MAGSGPRAQNAQKTGGKVTIVVINSDQVILIVPVSHRGPKRDVQLSLKLEGSGPLKFLGEYCVQQRRVASNTQSEYLSLFYSKWEKGTAQTLLSSVGKTGDVWIKHCSIALDDSYCLVMNDMRFPLEDHVDRACVEGTLRNLVRVFVKDHHLRPESKKTPLSDRQIVVTPPLRRVRIECDCKPVHRLRGLNMLLSPTREDRPSSVANLNSKKLLSNSGYTESDFTSCVTGNDGILRSTIGKPKDRVLISLLSGLDYSFLLALHPDLQNAKKWLSDNDCPAPSRAEYGEVELSQSDERATLSLWRQSGQTTLLRMVLPEKVQKLACIPRGSSSFESLNLYGFLAQNGERPSPAVMPNVRCGFVRKLVLRLQIYLGHCCYPIGDGECPYLPRLHNELQFDGQLFNAVMQFQKDCQGQNKQFPTLSVQTKNVYDQLLEEFTEKGSLYGRPSDREKCNRDLARQFEDGTQASLPGAKLEQSGIVDRLTGDALSYCYKNGLRKPGRVLVPTRRLDLSHLEEDHPIYATCRKRGLLESYCWVRDDFRQSLQGWHRQLTNHQFLWGLVIGSSYRDIMDKRPSGAGVARLSAHKLGLAVDLMNDNYTTPVLPFPVAYVHEREGGKTKWRLWGRLLQGDRNHPLTEDKFVKYDPPATANLKTAIRPWIYDPHPGRNGGQAADSWTMFVPISNPDFRDPDKTRVEVVKDYPGILLKAQRRITRQTGTAGNTQAALPDWSDFFVDITGLASQAEIDRISSFGEGWRSPNISKTVPIDSSSIESMKPLLLFLRDLSDSWPNEKIGISQQGGEKQLFSPTSFVAFLEDWWWYMDKYTEEQKIELTLSDETVLPLEDWITCFKNELWKDRQFVIAEDEGLSFDGASGEWIADELTNINFTFAAMKIRPKLSNDMGKWIDVFDGNPVFELPMFGIPRQLEWWHFQAKDAGGVTTNETRFFDEAAKIGFCKEGLKAMGYFEKKTKKKAK